jgi:lysozyme
MGRAIGVDVNHFVPVKDWDALYMADVSFIGIKATEGLTSVDPMLGEHRTGFRRRPFALGIFYHFGRPGDAAKQARRFAERVGVLRDHERLALDLEVVPTPNPHDAIKWVTDFIEEIRVGTADRRPILYTSAAVWAAMGNPAWTYAGEVDLWTPRYNTSGTEPVLPAPWANVGWTIWQFSDGTIPSNNVAGVGKCDGNYFRGDEAELIDYAKLSTSKITRSS